MHPNVNWDPGCLCQQSPVMSKERTLRGQQICIQGMPFAVCPLPCMECKCTGNQAACRSCANATTRDGWLGLTLQKDEIETSLAVPVDSLVCGKSKLVLRQEIKTWRWSQEVWHLISHTASRVGCCNVTCNKAYRKGVTA